PPAICGAGRDRGSTGTSGAALWLTTLPVHWSGESPPAACPDRGGAQRDPAGRLVGRSPRLSDPLFAVRCPAKCCLSTVTNSPPVSLLGLGHHPGARSAQRLSKGSRKQDAPVLGREEELEFRLIGQVTPPTEGCEIDQAAALVSEAGGGDMIGSGAETASVG